MSTASAPVLAAGAVCWRVSSAGRVKILLVHRTQHKDVSLPKGKLDPGETLPETAVREIAEETGLRVALGVPLGRVSYTLPSGRPKEVSYWAAEVSRAAIARSTFVANDEIERLEWVSLSQARRMLTYPHDVEIVDTFEALHEADRLRTFAVIALRHGKATPPENWNGPDSTRPLLPRGIEQALSVAPAIAAYRPRKLLSSDAVRCLTTIAPTARATGLAVKERAQISQDAYRSSGTAVQEVVRKRLDKAETTVLCSHGPVLPQIVGAVAALTGTVADARLQRAAALATGEYAVLHVSLEHPEDGLVAVEVHAPAA